MIVYHYTSEDAYDQIMSTQEFLPSLFSIVLDAAYGEGWYFTDLDPSVSDHELYQLWGQPAPQKIRRFLVFNIDSTLLQRTRAHVYRLPLDSIRGGRIRLNSHIEDNVVIQFVGGGSRTNSPNSGRNNFSDERGKLLFGLVLIGVIAVLISSLLSRGKS